MGVPELPDPKLMWRAKYRIVFPYMRNHLFVPDQVVLPGEKPTRFDYVERIKLGIVNPNLELARFRTYFRHENGSRIRRLGQAMGVFGNSGVNYDTGFPRMPQISEAFNQGKKFSFDEVGWIEIFASEKVSASAYLYAKQEQRDLAWAVELQGQHGHLRKSVIIDERDVHTAVDENEIDPITLPFLPPLVQLGKTCVALSVGPGVPGQQADETHITFVVRPEQTMYRYAIVAQHKLQSTSVDRVVNRMLPSQLLAGAGIELRCDPSFELVDIITIQPADALALAGRTLYIEWLSG